MRNNKKKLTQIQTKTLEILNLATEHKEKLIKMSEQMDESLTIIKKENEDAKPKRKRK